MSTTTVWIVIAGIGIGSLVLRAAFLVLPTFQGEVPEVVKERLSLVPPAAFAALVAPSFLMPEGDLAVLTPELAAGVVSLLVALRWRSLALTILVGLAVYAVGVQL